MAYLAWTDLTWPAARKLGDDPETVALLPLGALEQHGPHLPLATDSLIAERLARSVAERLARPVVVAPVIAEGLSDHHTGFAGTVSLDARTLGGIVEAFVASLERTGIRRCALISAHGGNFGEMARLAERCGTEHVRVIAFADFSVYLEEMFKAAGEVGVDPPRSDVHAGAIETGLAQHLFPHLVGPGWAEVEGVVDHSPDFVESILADGVLGVSATGVLGVPRLASPELGRAVFERLVATIASWLDDECAGVT
jgi:creatinine amidohydrolase/Fe(II)-dependent formamide hydrolase-like protein